MKIEFKVRDKQTGKYIPTIEKNEENVSLSWIAIDETGVYQYERVNYPESDLVDVTDISQLVEVECEILQLGRDLKIAGSSIKLARQVLYDNLVI